jgi:hypothetical protein
MISSPYWRRAYGWISGARKEEEKQEEEEKQKDRKRDLQRLAQHECFQCIRTQEHTHPVPYLLFARSPSLPQASAFDALTR